MNSVRVVLLLMLLSQQVAQAVPKTNDGNAAIVKAQGMIRQLTQEKAALQAEKQQWQAEKADLEARVQTLDASAARLPALQSQLEHYKNALESVRGGLESQLDQERQSRRALLEKHNTVVGKAKAIHADNLLLVKAVQEREQWMQTCGEQVQKLRQLNLEIVRSYRDKGFLAQLAELEPFTGIGQVDTEVAVEDYVYKLKQLQVTPFEINEAEPEAVPAESPLPQDEAQP
ncbi:DUF3450 domain-containing protein [Methylomonas sp. SURF-2]|uniref:DUF3450 domain-containing protein n=1 Tax=Methylomonas subterranea TaxID=2952225 RepID=A0ABT1TJX1_9GAMM|nr:DUF3450 domain-containing protein [Methylomonas sp. SURF-2]MCQ8105763.1 DUF3450 domain-containing protein [Methylomonas sp. SURF-2]